MFLKCRCEKPPFSHLDYESSELGEDSSGAEVSIEMCKKCGVSWLKYFIEEPHYSGSGRWWIVKLSTASISTLEAKEYIQSQAWCFVGGSFHNSAGKKLNAPITIT